MPDLDFKFMGQQAAEHQAWLDVVAELRARSVGAIEAGEKDNPLHNAIVRWGEELSELRRIDPDPTHAENSLHERRALWVNTVNKARR